MLNCDASGVVRRAIGLLKNFFQFKNFYLLWREPKALVLGPIFQLNTMEVTKVKTKCLWSFRHDGLVDVWMSKWNEWDSGVETVCLGKRVSLIPSTLSKVAKVKILNKYVTTMYKKACFRLFKIISLLHLRKKAFQNLWLLRFVDLVDLFFYKNKS